MNDKLKKFFNAGVSLLPLIFIVVVGYVVVDVQLEAIKNASEKQCQQALDTNFTMEKDTDGWVCKTSDGSYRPNITLINDSKIPDWMLHAAGILVILFLFLSIPYWPRPQHE